MRILEIVQPGTWLESPDRNWAHSTFTQIHLLTDRFFEAHASLIDFEQARFRHRHRHDPEQRKKDDERKAAISIEAYAKMGLRVGHEATSLESEVRFKREAWAAGRLPYEFEHGSQFRAARSFVYALDSFGKHLKVLAEKTPNTPPALSNLHAAFVAFLPDLTGVRNTAQHTEDRGRRLGKGENKPLPSTGDSAGIVSPGVTDLLVLDFLQETRYSATMADGNVGQIDVSYASLEIAQKVLQAALDAFVWTGPARHMPSAPYA